MTADLRLRFPSGSQWVQPGRTPITPPPPPPGGGGTSTLNLLTGTFAGLTVANPISLADYRTAMGDSNVSSTSNLARTSVGNDATRGRYIRQSFAASVGDGITAFVDGPFLGKQLTNVKMSYWLRFNGGLGKGCKLPGPGGVNGNASPNDATGGKTPITTDAYSGRLMHLRPGSGETSTDPDMSHYMYHWGQGDKYGDDVLWGTGPVIGDWNFVEIEHWLNAVPVSGSPSSDGKLIGRWNGVDRVNRTNYIFRGKPDIFINYLYWHLFWGGADKAAWAPSVASSIDIAGLTISTEVPN